MPTFRGDLDGLVTYVPGKPIEDVAREHGFELDEIVKLASNESPHGPFPGVAEAIGAAIADSNRYPDTEALILREAMSKQLGVETDSIWFGAGSVGLLTHIAYGVGGRGTSAVYAWPSFIMYRIISRWAQTEPIEVPLSPGYAIDTEALAAAIRDDTTVLYLCNPNNPTATVIGADPVADLIGRVPDSVLVVVDEAYHDYVTDPSYQSAISIASSRDNVVVLRTFSKIYGLAAHRIGYAVGQPQTLEKLQRTQAPFTVSSLAQAAALASLGQPDELKRRAESNAAGRHQLSGVLAERGLEHSKSEANFVYFRLDRAERAIEDRFLDYGVIVRPMSGGWVRVTVGSPTENQRFVDALDGVLASY